MTAATPSELRAAPRGESARYTSVAIALHWVLAAAIGAMFFLGHNMEGNEARYQLHKTLGITILFLTIARIAWRALNPPPPLPADMNRAERTASHFVHMGFYALLLLIPLSGWLMVSVSPFQVPTVLYGLVSWPHLPAGGTNEAFYELTHIAHEWLSWAMVGLLALHVAGALKHELSSEEGVLKRMAPGLFGKTAAPRLPGKGALAAFGNAALLFALIAAAPLIASAFGNGGTAAVQPANGATAAVDANWVIDREQSSVTFSGMHDGNAFDGKFRDWESDVRFSEDDLAGSRATMTVLTGSAAANKKLYTDSLKATEWLDTGAFPMAQVVVDNFRRDGDAFAADAAVTLKGIGIERPLRFTLEPLEDGRVRAVATTQMERTPLDLGQQSDPGAEWVSEAIDVTVTLVADPAG